MYTPAFEKQEPRSTAVSVESTVASPESAEIDELTKELITSMLQAHYTDIEPGWHGEKSIGKKYARDNAAVSDNVIVRGECEIAIDELRLLPGSSLILVGPNGAGKSTVFDAIRNQRHADFANGNYGYGDGFHNKDSIRISHLDQEELLRSLEGVHVRSVLDVVERHFKSQFPIDWEDGDAYEQNINNQEAEMRIEAVLSKFVKLFEMDVFLDRQVHELSGGERTKLALLMTLGSEPDVLLLDEPTNHLDLESIAKLQGLFETYARAGATVVSSSHVGWFKERAGTDGVLAISIDEDNERSLTYSTSSYGSFVKNRELQHGVARPSFLWKSEQKYAFVEQAVFATQDAFSIPDSPIANMMLPDITGGDITVLSGKNGTGKSKLMAEMANKQSDIFKKEKGLQVAYLPQTWPAEIAGGTVQDFFNWVKSTTNSQSDVEASRLAKVVREMHIRPNKRNILDQPLGSFSGGEQRLLWFAAASLMEGTDMLVLDEPTNHMDEQAVDQITQAIRDFPGGVVLSTHDLRLMQSLEKDSGHSRQGIAPTNIVLEKIDGVTTVDALHSAQSPSEYSEAILAAGKKAAGHLKLTA